MHLHSDCQFFINTWSVSSICKSKTGKGKIYVAWVHKTILYISSVWVIDGARKDIQRISAHWEFIILPLHSISSLELIVESKVKLLYHHNVGYIILLFTLHFSVYRIEYGIYTSRCLVSNGILKVLQAFIIAAIDCIVLLYTTGLYCLLSSLVNPPSWIILQNMFKLILCTV